MSQRIFNHKKQYACTEVFRLEDLQNLILELEDAADEERNDRRLPYRNRHHRLDGLDIPDVINRLQEFINNLTEQERQK
jgi:hypothetical protein